MKMWQKVTIGAAVVVVGAGIVIYSVNQANKGVTTVQTAKVAKQDTLVSLVTASGEIKPTTYTNVQAQAAALNVSESGIAASEASYRAAQADLLTQKANLEKAKLDFDRGQGLYKDGLIPKQDFDQRKTTYDAAVASVDSANAKVLQVRAQLDQSRAQLNQTKAVLTHTRDVLNKTTYLSPIDGIVSYLPVRLGEYVVPGIQNSNGSFLMTLSDMSTVTAEVKVDETDIVNV